MEKIINLLKDNNVNNIVIEEKLINDNELTDNLDIIKVLDVRSALYYATGICASNKEKVAVICSSDNASRSAFSGLTEAFYRSMPIIFITLGNDLNYNVEIKDVFNTHYVINNVEDFNEVLTKEISGPTHIELLNYNGVSNNNLITNINLENCIHKILLDSDYLYVLNSINLNLENLTSKVVKGGLRGCVDGVVSNVLGASLAKLHSKYICVLSKEEFLHDMNSLGNINVNDSLCFIILTKDLDHKVLIEDYVQSLKFDFYDYANKEINAIDLEKIIHSNAKSVLLINGD